MGTLGGSEGEGSQNEQKLGRGGLNERLFNVAILKGKQELWMNRISSHMLPPAVYSPTTGAFMHSPSITIADNDFYSLIITILSIRTLFFFQSSSSVDILILNSQNP